MNVLRSSLPPHSGSKWLKSAKMFIHLMCFHEFSQLKQRLADYNIISVSGDCICASYSNYFKHECDQSISLILARFWYLIVLCATTNYANPPTLLRAAPSTLVGIVEISTCQGINDSRLSVVCEAF